MNINGREVGGATRTLILYIENTETELQLIRSEIAEGKTPEEIAAGWEESLDDIADTSLAERPGLTGVWSSLLRTAFEEIEWDTVVEYFEEKGGR